MPDEPVIHVEIGAQSLDDLRRTFDELEPDPGCRPVAKRVGDEYVAHAYLGEADLDRARATTTLPGVRITVIENASEVGQRRQSDLSPGNRYAGRSIPRGYGRKE